MVSTVTWLLPVLNGRHYLEATLNSLASQTYRGCYVLAWDNGSNDGSIQLLNEWIPARIPGRLVVGRPMGLGLSLATMVEESETEFCARIDADDICDPVRIEKQMAFLKAHPEVVALGSQVRRMSSAGELGGQYHELPLNHVDIVLRLSRRWAMWHPSMLLRRSAVLAAGNYRDERPVEDYSLWLRMAKVGQLANMPDCLLNYRVHDKSITATDSASGVMEKAFKQALAAYGPNVFGLEANRLLEAAAGHRELSVGDVLRIGRTLLKLPTVSPGMIWHSKEWQGMMAEGFNGFSFGKRCFQKLCRITS